MYLRRSLISMGAFALAASHAAQAQSVDYGQLEQLFGEPVTTSATGSPQKASDAPANIEIISAEDIRRSGADNIPDVLRFVSGIDVRRYGASDAEVSVRGYSQTGNPRLLVLINGRQVYLDDYGYTVWEILPVQLDEIRQIEIVKGPASALFGFNAASGVINIVTYDPLSDKTDAVTVRGGTQANFSGSAVGTFHIGETAGLRLSVGGNRGDEYNTSSAQPSSFYYSQPHEQAVSLDGRYKPTATTELSFEATENDSRNYEQALDYTPSNTAYRTNSFKLGFAADTDWGLANVTAYRNESRFTLENDNANQSVKNDIYVVQANDLFKVGTANAFRVGVEYRNNYGEAAGFSNSIGYEDYAASGMWNWQIVPELSFTNSVRFDYLTVSRDDSVVDLSPYSRDQYNAASISEPSFNSGLVYKPTDVDTVRLLVGRAVQAPSLIDYGVQSSTAVSGSPLHVVLVGNPNLNASTVMNYEADYDRALPGIYSTFRSAVYYELTQNILTSPISQQIVFSNPTTLFAQSDNIGHSNAVGGEIGIKGTNNGFRWNLDYSLVVITDHLDVSSAGALAPTAIEYQHATPTNAVDFGIGYTWGRLEADLQGKWQSSFKDYQAVGNLYQPITINDYVTFNARVGYNVNDYLTVALTGEQINDARIVEAAGIPTERRVIASATLRY